MNDEKSIGKIAEKDDWDTEDMPRKKRTFILKRTFSEKETEILRRGNIPREMEDKWFFYMQGDMLYAHRSWTGFCIYTVKFSDGGKHLVTVNRDRRQYSCRSLKKDREALDKLLDLWTREPYDYYGEWLNETIDSINDTKLDKKRLNNSSL